MGKINLIDQLRKRGRSAGSGASSSSGSSTSFQREPEVEFEDATADSGSGLDAYEKRRLVMLVLGICLVLGGRQLVPMYTQDMENAARNESNELDQKIAQEQKQGKSLELIQGEMKQYDARVSDLRAKLQKVQQLNEDRNLLVRMADYIVKEMPQRLWFERVEIDTRTRVTISGYSFNYQIVSDFMKKLEGAVYFPEWRLVQTQNQGNSVAPQIQGALAPPLNAVVIPPDSKRFELEAETARL